MRRKRSDPAAHTPPRERRTPERPPARFSHNIPHCPGLLRYARTLVVNSESLVPLLLAYGEDLPGDGAALPADGNPAVEQALLRTMRTALESLPAPAPPTAAVDAVLAAARTASAASELAPLRATLAGEDHASVEGTLLRTTLSAVERASRPAPPAEVVARVVAAARDAANSSDLAALRAALSGERAAGELSAERALLQTTIQALDALPRSTPPPDVVASIVEAAGAAARSSELSPVRAAVGLAAGRAGVEEQILRTTWEAVERMPRSAPPVSAVQAVLSAASAAVPTPLREAAALRRAADRPAAPRYALSYRRFAYLTAALAFVGFVGVGLWASGDGRRDSGQSIASLDEQPARMADGVPEASAESDASVVPEISEGAAPPTDDLIASDLDRPAANSRAPRASDAFRNAEPAFARPAATPPPPPTPAEVPEREGLSRDERLAARPTAPTGAGVGLAAVSDRPASPGAGLAGAPSVTPAWEAGSDVRLLSLRLQELQEGASGLAWDEPPSPLGAAESGAAAPAGFNAVGTSTAPARFQVRVGPPGSD